MLLFLFLFWAFRNTLSFSPSRSCYSSKKKPHTFAVWVKRSTSSDSDWQHQKPRRRKKKSSILVVKPIYRPHKCTAQRRGNYILKHTILYSGWKTIRLCFHTRFSNELQQIDTYMFAHTLSQDIKVENISPEKISKIPTKMRIPKIFTVCVCGKSRLGLPYCNNVKMALCQHGKCAAEI